MKKVYLYATCLGTAALQESVLNAIKLLRRENIEVIFKKKQTCCGQPSFNSGYFEESKNIALYNVNLFEEDYPIVVVSGSCAGMMSHDYLELLKDSPDFAMVKNFSSRVIELSQYLDKVLNVNYEDKGEPIKVTWHSNCHALRVQKSIESSKNLINKLKNVELVELEYEEECCGFGGTFSVKEPAISNAMVKTKIEDIKKTGVKYLISGDGGCLMNIGGTMKRMGLDIKGVHLYDFLLKRIQGERL
ncbi:MULTISPECIES: (Fe-S)-binding protein [unclassified Campylobacter]|uniref:(Fe-S)-binding protein n=1 Tax=unclassified Campylobacter TaxID=2593542 RepID=UPI001237D33B|nr:MULTISPECIES: (Fe-S)-binding protein [unclassified Campylobacter]KAA6225037.1 (Fe-S)-binding protein [Campylobacter sp. LR185c]KAA6225996.1 (Fe-S)-binding protein [Campylobacter sp. LR196d]KAA6226059.1 (Fe-S)-binding protein [Campylobacter sp. LR286c]KAA6230991.1 (Fe-S)-binding protein [Campylobacter sp. LR291e]KAA8603364.1 oxidoreductase [Campylobacter sp. LR185c]